LKLSEKIDFDIIPLNQCNEIPGVSHLNEDEEKAFTQRITELNAIIADDKLLEIEFNKYCEKVNPMYDAFIEPYFGKTITSLRKRGLFPKLMGKRKRLLLLNITRCESHREVLQRLLKKYE
jgi:poly-gamma-glutamate synthesis protein (capsule biosynthesis protein)